MQKIRVEGSGCAQQNFPIDWSTDNGFFAPHTAWGKSLCRSAQADRWNQGDRRRSARFGNSIWEELTVDVDYYHNPCRFSLFTSANGEDNERLWSQTKSIVLYGLGTAGILALMPEEVTNWQKSDESLAQKWLDNVTTMPFWDNDDLWLKYIGHPYFGGIFYITARKAGYRRRAGRLAGHRPREGRKMCRLR